jgi:nudix motif 8
MKPLPSLDMSTLVLSPREVAHTFHLTLAEARAPKRISLHHFRGRRPYWAVDVTDFAPLAAPAPYVRDEAGGGRSGRLEVWGLTGWYLSRAMCMLREALLENT